MLAYIRGYQADIPTGNDVYIIYERKGTYGSHIKNERWNRTNQSDHCWDQMYCPHCPILLRAFNGHINNELGGSEKIQWRKGFYFDLKILKQRQRWQLEWLVFSRCQNGGCVEDYFFLLYAVKKGQFVEQNSNKDTSLWKEYTVFIQINVHVTGSHESSSII